MLAASGKVIYAEDDLVVLDKTPFYAESGGQISDVGMLVIGSDPYRVVDVKKLAGGAAIRPDVARFRVAFALLYR